MGQRHQAFLIAKIIPHGDTDAKYRCVAAMHHQWCFGSLPLHATRRLLTLLKKPEHATIVIEELRTLDGKYGRWGVSPKMPPIPCPFSSFLMLSAFNFDLGDDPEETYQGSYFDPLNCNMGSSEGDNNDGITVVDITDPRNPAYCFAFPKRSPLTATQYIRGYYPVPTPGEENDNMLPEEVVLDAVVGLEGERLVTLRMLAEAWPAEYHKRYKRDVEKPNSKPDPGAVPAASQIPPLSELALKPTVVHALETGDTKDIEQLMWLPGKAQTMIEILKSYEPLSDLGVSLLAQAIDHLSPENVDLSSLSLSTPQIVALLTNVPNVQILDLSHNRLVTADAVHIILKSTPTLRRLVLLDTSVTDEALSSLLRDHPKLFFNLEALTHSLLLNNSTSKYSNSFAIIADGITGASIPFFTSSFIIQALTDYLHACLHSSFFSSDLKSSVPQIILSSTVRKVTETWATRTVPMIASSSLDSAINGEGWIFGLNEDGSYGFIEAKPGDINAFGSTSASGSGGQKNSSCVERVLDLEDFLTEIEIQGRPPAPASAVEGLCALLNKLKGGPSDKESVWGRPSFKLMTMPEANQFIRIVNCETRSYANNSVDKESESHH
ncbi:hypothetical protein C0992_012472 [Termitomyces sp. T32_za158]|nr:hypothetical protein C0992_012472 [Termitomyces sp. T32_za158]